jgi:hypothetical protein
MEKGVFDGSLSSLSEEDLIIKLAYVDANSNEAKAINSLLTLKAQKKREEEREREREKAWEREVWGREREREKYAIQLVEAKRRFALSRGKYSLQYYPNLSPLNSSIDIPIFLRHSLLYVYIYTLLF